MSRPARVNQGGFRMSYAIFQQRVTALIGRAGGGITVRFREDRDKGRFFANCSDGTTIIARPGSMSVTVRYGSGHQSMTAL